MIPAWLSLVREPFSSSKLDFVSVDARRMSDTRNYEMLTSPAAVFSPGAKTPDLLVTNMESSSRAFSPSNQVDYFGKEARYQSPDYSFSSPKPPARSASAATRTESRVTFGREWDPSSTYAPGRFSPASNRTSPGPGRSSPIAGRTESRNGNFTPTTRHDRLGAF